MTILMSALALAGPTLKPLADQAVKDGYAELRKLLVERFGSKTPSMERALDVHAEDPKTFEPAAEKVLREAGADQDEEVLRKATELLKQAERVQPGISGGVYQYAEKITNIHGDFHGTLNM